MDCRQAQLRRNKRFVAVAAAPFWRPAVGATQIRSGTVVYRVWRNGTLVYRRTRSGGVNYRVIRRGTVVYSGVSK